MGFYKGDYSALELSPKILEHLMDFERIDRHDPSLDLSSVFFKPIEKVLKGSWHLEKIEFRLIEKNAIHRKKNINTYYRIVGGLARGARGDHI